MIAELSGLTDQQRSWLLERLATNPALAQGTLAELESECRDRCLSDGLFFLQFVKTRDEADPVQTVKPFPLHLEYVRSLWSVLQDSQRVVIAKSRQMLASWMLCAYAVWTARFRPNQLVIWQTQTWPDAVEKTCGPSGAKMGRCQFMEANLPAWLAQEIKYSEGCLDYPNGSRIQALPGGADKVRGLTASVIIEDEFAMQAEAKGVYAAVAPLIQKGCQFIAMSTPNGIGQTFADLFFGFNTRSIPGRAD